MCEKDFIWNPAEGSNSMITCDQIVGETKTNQIKKQPVKHKISTFYLHFY